MGTTISQEFIEALEKWVSIGNRSFDISMTSKFGYKILSVRCNNLITGGSKQVTGIKDIPKK
jgi:hypothetical protein